jgi:hypothetical protein
VPNANHVPRDQSNMESNHSRPLWLSEINKDVPAGATYELESNFGAKSALMKTRAFAFNAHNSEMNKTMKEQSAISNFKNKPESYPKEGICSYDINLS